MISICGVIQLLRSGTVTQTVVLCSPPHAPLIIHLSQSLMLKLMPLKLWPLALLDLFSNICPATPAPQRYKRDIFWCVEELLSVSFQKVERLNPYTTLSPYGTLPKTLAARFLIRPAETEYFWIFQNLEYVSAFQNSVNFSNFKQDRDRVEVGEGCPLLSTYFRYLSVLKYSIFCWIWLEEGRGEGWG